MRLKTDLTRYLAGLIVGSEGYTVGQYGMWSRGSDRFVGVHFPGIGTLDVLWEGLEIIDEEYLREAAERKAQLWEALKSATDVEVVRGPRGGFRYLSYRYIGPDGIPTSRSTGFKDEAEELLTVFRDQGIRVAERQES